MEKIGIKIFWWKQAKIKKILKNNHKAKNSKFFS